MFKKSYFQIKMTNFMHFDDDIIFSLYQKPFPKDSRYDMGFYGKLNLLWSNIDHLETTGLPQLYRSI